MTRARTPQFSTTSWTTSLTLLSLITGVTLWHLARTLPFETLSSPGDLLGIALGFGLALAVAILGSLTEGHSRETFVILSACIFALTIAEYLLDSHAYDWIDPYVALCWLALGICLASSRLMGTLSGPTRICIGIGLAIETAELLRSTIAVAIYGDAAQPLLSQWFESESDLLLRAAYLIGVFELCYSKAMAHPASTGAGNPSSLWSLMAGVRRQKGRTRFEALCPDAGPGGYYASKVIRRLDDGHGHPTLGNRSFGFKFPFLRRPRRADEFPREGLTHFNFALRAGLRPDHVCVDYGCGSLRVGQHLIHYLKAGNYWGLDVVDRFFRDGFDLLPQQSRAKSPQLRIINVGTLDETAKARPDFVVCFAVLTHVAREELDITIGRILDLPHDTGTIVLSFYIADSYVQRGATSFTHKSGSIEAMILARRPSATIRILSRRPRRKKKPEWEIHLAIGLGADTTVT